MKKREKERKKLKKEKLRGERFGSRVQQICTSLELSGKWCSTDPTCVDLDPTEVTGSCMYVYSV